MIKNRNAVLPANKFAWSLLRGGSFIFSSLSVEPICTLSSSGANMTKRRIIITVEVRIMSLFENIIQKYRDASFPGRGKGCRSGMAARCNYGIGS
jgi:hypothetical protein